MSGGSCFLPDELVEAAKPYAVADGRTVCTWMRDLARREIERREAAPTIHLGPGLDPETIGSLVARELRFGRRQS